MEFTETLTLRMPSIEDRLSEFEESSFSASHGLVIEVAAIHEGMTANFNYYSGEELTASLESWTKPYPKPIILHHDPYTEPLGRVIGAKMDKEDDGTPYVRLQVAVTDPTAMQKIKDQRYLTGSVGGKAGEAACNICGADWAKASMMSVPCKHSRGKTYKGKVAAIEMKDLSFKEYSFVNMPADSRSGVRSLGTALSESEEALEFDGEVSSARFFSLDMNKESIMEFCESETRDVLAGMKKKEVAPLYHGLRGSFLSALAVAEEDNETKENGMANVETPVAEEEEDLLAVTEELSADLAIKSEEGTEEVQDEEVVAEEATDDTPAEELVVEAEAEVTDEAPVEEGERPDGQEKDHAADVDPETSKGADKTRESEEADEVVEEKVDEPVDSTELNEALKALESRVAELETREQALTDENVKLKAALKRGLAERVVDMKVALGMVEADERETQLTEHITRSATSLADSLRDLAAMPKAQVNYNDIPKVGQESLGVDTKGEPSVTIIELEAEEQNTTPDPEDIFVEVLMGRKSL